MRIDEACESTFARHETFHPRWGWVKKAYDASLSSPRVFVSDDATLKLGVGKNMVKSIRFWGHAFRALTFEADGKSTRAGVSVPSTIGSAIFDKNGWDPFTEEIGTLWLLHWLLLAPKSQMPVWWIAFNEFGAVEFTQQQLTDFVCDQVESVSTWSAKPHRSSIEKDVSCLLRTYAPSEDLGRRQSFDDIVDCPMREIGLIRSIDPSGKRFRFAMGSKATLPSEIILYACADFLARTDSHSRTVTVSRLSTEAGAPGRVFKLSESDLVEALEHAATTISTIKIARPAGAVQIAFTSSPAAVATEALSSYYRRRNLGVGPTSGVFAGAQADTPNGYKPKVRSK
jgi:hypothetical protein